MIILSRYVANVVQIKYSFTLNILFPTGVLIIFIGDPLNLFISIKTGFLITCSFLSAS